MMRILIETRAAALRWYRRLLRIYPRAFRDRFGHGSRRAVRRSLRAARAPLAAPRRFWIRIVLDTLRHGGRERLDAATPTPASAAIDAEGHAP